MNNVTLKTPTVWAAALTLLPFMACSDISEGEYAPDSGKTTGVVFKMAGAPMQQAPVSGDRLSEVNVFHFNGDDFLMQTVVDDPYADVVNLPSNGTTRIYCVSGLEINLTASLSQSQFAAMTAVSLPGAEYAPLFYTATADFSEEAIRGGQLSVDLKRSVARIDFSNTAETGFRVTQVIVEDAPQESFVFESEEPVECATVSYSREFAEPFYGTEEEMFLLFESKNPVHIRIMGEYQDSPLNIRTTLPRVERNKLYTLKMVNANSTVEGTFTIKDWEEGAAVNANPSAGGYYSIDRLNSVIPENVTADYARNLITVTHSGASDIKVAFVAPEKIKVASLDGEVPTVKITQNDPVSVEAGYLSSFNVDVEPNNRLTYKVVVNLLDDAGRGNFVEIQVLENPSRSFDTVEMAGRTWMAFNAMSSDPAVQVFPVDGLTVEEMYRQNWATSIGSFFQYGRALGYSPWTKNDPNGNEDTPRDCPWGTPEAMPVPPGYHVATTADWQALMPAGTTFPSTYTAANGEEIKAELVTLPGTLNASPSAAANKAGLLMRYLRFESLKTGNVLIIPICGMKTASWDEYPGGGRAMHAWGGYWIYEDRCLWLFQVGGTAEQPVVSQSSSRWNYNGFMPVRGVKNLD